MLYVIPILALGIYLMNRYFDSKSVLVINFDKARINLSTYDPGWEYERQDSLSELCRINILRNDKPFQKLLSEYSYLYIDYANYYMGGAEQKHLFKILKISTNEKLRDKIMELLITENKKYKQTKVQSVVK